MNREESARRLQEAQSLAVMTLEDVHHKPKNISDEEFAEYLKDFAKPTGMCWYCENSLVVEWGIAHGYGHCSSCGMDAKMYHYFEKDGKRERWEAGLQFHPKGYSVEGSEDE